MFEQKPYAPSCDKNTDPILEVLKLYLPEQKSLLEFGAGTGQHAIAMAPHFPNIVWTISDREENHKGIQLWLQDFPRVNLRGPLSFDIDRDTFPEGHFDTVFTANTLHILSWEQNLKLYSLLGESLPNESLFLVYGAFNYNGNFTSESNQRFEQWLKNRDPKSGIRDFESVSSELFKVGFDLIRDHEMPANNRLLVFKKCR
ncbi:MAG: DUF938 domain-containing protein [Bdellovibrionales bacterium]|nr:DUF938 domain-containing protein [Bdellovibrionales bacterium]